MADRNKILQNNVPGEFFVDSTCINCDTCRQLAPNTFQDSGEFSFVYSQPKTQDEKRKALRALVSCPTGSIGSDSKGEVKEVMSDFPLKIEDEVYYCGFNSPKSYGGNSYFIQHKEGNWLIDSPKYLPHLVKRFEEMGGIANIFLTHIDDVAESGKYAEHFGSKRMIHEKADVDAEIKLASVDPIQVKPDFLIIPTPGHTRCHCVLLYKNYFLFTGDHLSWSRDHHTLRANKDVCWYSWEEQTKSMEKLEQFSFQWILPGHGQRIKLEAGKSTQELKTLVKWMKTAK